MPQYNDAYDPSIHEHLDKVDWDAVFPGVLKYAVWKAKQFEWLGDKMDPESLVQEAIARVYGIGSDGAYRNWNRTSCPDISVFLKGIIRSMTSHVAAHEATFPTESLFNKDGSPRDKELLESTAEVAGSLKTKTPEEELIESNIQSLRDELDRISSEDDDLGMVILSFDDGASKPRDIAAQTGIEINKVYNLLKRLARKLKRFDPKKRIQSSKERREEWA